MLNKKIIYQYMNKISKDDIVNYGLKQNINLSNSDVEIIYYYIKKDYQRLFDNTEDILLEIRDKISNNAYKKILELYDKYKYIIDKIQ